MTSQELLALISAIASLVVSVVTAAIAYITRVRGDTRIAELQHSLTEIRSERSARRDYEYEARKRLYLDLQPELFLLAERSGSALDCISQMVLDTRNGQIRSPSQLGEGWEEDAYGMVSTAWKLFVPLVHFRIAQQRLTGLDLSVDPVVRWQYVLAREIYYSWTAGIELSRQHPKINYDGGRRETREHVFSGHLERAVDLMIQPDAAARQTCISYAEFSSTFFDETRWAAWRYFTYPLTNFHPALKPVVWRVLLTQAHLYSALIETFDSATGTNPSLVHPLCVLPESGWGNYDWRMDEKVSKEEAVGVPFSVARSYIQNRLAAQRLQVLRS